MKHSRVAWSVLLAVLASLAAAVGSRASAQEPGWPYGEALVGIPVPYADAAAEARALIHEFMADRGIPGLSIAVGVEGKIVWSEGFGYANVELRAPVTTQTKFRSGSTAKAMTQAAATVLREQGRFDFDAPIQRYVSSFPDKGHVITPRQLMAHTSGIRHYPPDGDEFFSAKHYTDVVDALEIFADDPLLFEPGTAYSYSTYGASLLGAAIQGAAGEDFLTVLRKYVFEPLGMRSTVGDHADSIIPFRTSFYERTGQPPGYHRRKTSWGNGDGPGVLLNGPFTDNSNKRAGGGLLTTPEDLVRFASAHLEPGFLTAESLELMFTSARLKNGEETGRGLNWAIEVDDAGRRVISHGGGAVGGTAAMSAYLEEGVVVAIQCNLTDAGYGPLPTRIAELFIRAAQHAEPASARDRGGAAGPAGR